ncbi:hypothetical protein RF55_6537 [Lasius niger]|uniref:Endonuclease/exonuclease/phosphatase domain-containing protein n=1 Tax=Lasius niger TaxID=67767 RepID=A0A0J7NLL4_LASNI|nr:hypothetical protein RF55_6537 [Lasius niger]
MSVKMFIESLPVSNSFKGELSGKLRDRLTRMRIGVTVLAAELIPPGRPKEDVLDELIRDLKTLKKQIIEGKEQLGETSRLSSETPLTKTYKGKKKRESESQRVAVQRSSMKTTTSEQETTEAPNTEDGYPKDGEPWTIVLGRNKKKKQQLLQLQLKQQDGTATKILPTFKKTKGTVSPRKKKKTAAVAITTISDEISYKELMQLAKKNISLEKLQIDDIDCRRAMTGGLLLQIHGKDNQSKAEQLTDQLQNLFANNKSIKVYKPQQMAELRIMGIDDTITCEDIVNTVAEIGGCRMSEMRTGPIRIAGRGMGTLGWRCCLEEDYTVLDVCDPTMRKANVQHKKIFLIGVITAAKLATNCRGSVPTCVREQGSSIVDITMGSSEVARMIGDWRVDDGAESLSDHRYVKFSLGEKVVLDRDKALAYFPRWNYKKIDRDVFNATLHARLWSIFREKDTIDEDIKYLENTLTQACDLVMPKIKSIRDKKATY